MRTWNIIIETRSGHDGIATGGHYGSWAKVWASRKGITDVRTVAERDAYYPGRPNGHKSYKEIEVSLTDLFDENKDFVLVEHKRTPNPYLRGSSSRERYELLAGSMPDWASFPQAWGEWVRKQEVQKCASEHICKKCPEAQELVLYAERKCAKRMILSAWDRVAEACGCTEIRRNGSWTAAYAMPIRIAQKLGGFRPPIPRPRWENREEGVNAFLIASPD